jgi:hypothetical protein
MSSCSPSSAHLNLGRIPIDHAPLGKRFEFGLDFHEAE